MAEEASASLSHEAKPNGHETCESCSNPSPPVEAEANGTAGGASAQETFSIEIRLPHEPYKTQTIVSVQDQAQDVRQSIIDLPHTFQYSCFHLEHDGNRIPDYVDLGEIKGIHPNSKLNLVEDPYTEKDARIHFLRVRDLIGAAGDRTDLVQGVHAGLSLFDNISGGQGDASAANGNEQTPKSPSTDLHPMTGYELEAPGVLSTLIPPTQTQRPKTIKSISLSPWNPPPYHLRSKGHLLYLQLTTMEGEQHQITSHVTGFYVNKSSNSKFDPYPRTSPKSTSAHSLLTLISRLSPTFDNSFKALQDFNSKRDPLSAFQLSNAIPASPWAVPVSSSALSEHQPDMSRSQESYLVCGAENTETLRDWNEEFQTTRELPCETVQDRVFRERVTSKLFADYNDAATQGAVLIARGEVAPLNPTENKDAQIFVYNNVFYSFGADGVGTFANEGGDEAARVATGKDVMGIRNVNQLDIQGLSTPGTVVVDYLGKRLVGQSIVPGIFKQREPGEHQIDYGGVEGKDIVANNEAFAPLFNKLSSAMRVKKHAVWDKEGKRYDLEASIETKGLLGTDGRKYVLDLYRITPLDVLWIEKHWIEPPPGNEGKKDSKSYPHRMAVLRPELVDAYWRFKVREYAMRLKSEAEKKAVAEGGTAKSGLGESTEEAGGNTDNKGNFELKSAEDIPVVDGDIKKPANTEEKSLIEDQKVEDDTKTKPETLDLSGFNLALNPDVFSGQRPGTDAEKDEMEKDEAEVRATCDYLLADVIPRLLHDLREGEVGFPMDGQSLSSLLHKRGVNIRYLGKLAELANESDPRLQALRKLLIQEMIIRAFKHVSNKYLRHLPSPFATSCIAHLLNCLLGADANGSPVASIDEDLRLLYPEVNFDFEQLQPDLLQAEISAQVHLRYRFTLDDDWFLHFKHLQMLREIALKLGLQLNAKEYNFSKPDTAAKRRSVHFEEAPVIITNGHAPNGTKKKKKNGNAQSPPPNGIIPPSPATFGPEDIVNIVPVLKEASPRSVLAEEALEAGRISIAQNQREIGLELLLESLSLHEQIYGILHPEVARVYYQLSTSYYALDDKTIAVELARKAVIVAERTLGIDSSETILSYLNLALFEHANGNTQVALTYVRHALDLWKIVYGPNHPDLITTINNAAVMLQHMKLYHDSRQWFEASVSLCQSFSGRSSVNNATLLFQLAQALALDQDSKGAVTRMREAYNIFNTELGPNDRNTKEAETWLESLTLNAVSIAKHAKDLQARKQRRIHMTPKVTMTTRPQATELNGVGARPPATAVGSGTMDNRKIDDLIRYIEGDTGKQTTPKKTAAHPKRRQQKAH